MTSVIINLKTDPQVKSEAKRIAAKMGLTLSAVLNAYLYEFVRTRHLSISVSKISEEKERQWKKEEEGALKHGKSFTDVRELMADSLKYDE